MAGVDLRFQFVEEGDDGRESMSLLSLDERERAGRFVFARDRASFAAAHALLRRMLSDTADAPPDAWTFAETDHGKPVLASAHGSLDLRFNLAHTRGLVACAVCRGADVGVDVEPIDARVRPLDIASRYFSRAECDALERCGDDDGRRAQFIELWTLKEAYIKAVGQGLSHALDTFSFGVDGSGALRFVPPPGDPGGWRFALYAPAAQFRMAIAVRSRVPGITARARDGSVLDPISAG